MRAVVEQLGSVGLLQYIQWHLPTTQDAEDVEDVEGEVGEADPAPGVAAGSKSDLRMHQVTHTSVKVSPRRS